MRRATSSSSAAAPSLSHRKRIAREQLLKSLEILGPLSAPLPPELPPSPPPSPATSPRSKRKLEADLDQGRSKKPRTSLETSSVRPSLSQPRPRSIKSEPEEDGELKEEPVAIPDPVAAPTSSLPVRRPRRGVPHLDDKDLNEAHDKFFSNARLLKYSGGERLLSTFPATASNYKPLADPSPVGSSYYKNGEVIARLETIDALVHFAYSIWTKDYNLKTCYRRTWDTMKDMIALNKPYWEHGGEREKVFFGLITMIQGYISARRIRYMVKGAHAETQRLMTRFNIYASASMKRAAAEAAKAQSQTEAQAQPQSQAPPTPQDTFLPCGRVDEQLEFHAADIEHYTKHKCHLGGLGAECTA
ncbi:hypothetical protein A0H81_11802 [Grifola frondosa]|uniref:Uncharacterized protein n=1 Tax=Grifola frondosa TaxID=5627 RepID=A0A1C7LUN0_GRIFR|nr:hypothetical protein A0H81_11802 [Grifola frondosa]